MRCRKKGRAGGLQDLVSGSAANELQSVANVSNPLWASK